MNTLLTQTQAYWNISSTWNNRTKEKLTVQQALQLLNKILQSSKPKAYLRDKAKKLQTEIIMQPRQTKKPKKLDPPTKLDSYRKIATQLQMVG